MLQTAASTSIAFAAGAALFANTFGVFLWYQNRRYAAFDLQNAADG